MSSTHHDLLTATDPFCSAVVSACAGSGKTWLLITRIFRLLLAGVPPTEILAITFTRKAAAEMRERLQQLLEQCALLSEQDLRSLLATRGCATDDHTVARARALVWQYLSAEQGVEMATFHSWFARMAQLAPLETGLVRDVQPTAQPEVWHEQAVDALLWLAARGPSEAAGTALDHSSDQALGALTLDHPRLPAYLAASRPWLEGLLKAWGVWSTRQALVDLLNHRADMLLFFHTLKHPLLWPETLGVDESLSRQRQRWQAVASSLDQLFRLEGRLVSKLVRGEPPSQDAVLHHPTAWMTPAWIESWHLLCCAWQAGTSSERSKLEPWLAAMAELEELPSQTDGELSDHQLANAVNCVLSGFLTKSGLPRSFSLTKAARAALPATVDPDECLAIFRAGIEQALADRSDADHARLSMHVLALAPALLTMAALVKQQAGVCDFDDFELTSLQLLRDDGLSAYLRAKHAHRVQHVLVDEFQDTNPVQWQILQHILVDHVAVAEGGRATVFIVGDPKQSIYRFRRARSALFPRAATWLAERFDAQYHELQLTRRCSPALMQAVDAVFAAPGRTGRTPFPPHETFVATPTAAPGIPPGLWCMPLVAADEAGTDPRVLECQQVAATLRAWHDQGALPRWHSMLCLVRDNASAMRLAQACEAQAIPYSVADRGGRFKTLLWTDTLALLRVLMSPGHGLSLFTLLRSPWFMLSVPSLQCLLDTAHLHHLSLDAAIGQLAEQAETLTLSWPDGSEQTEHWGVIGDCLRRWRALGQGLPLQDALQRMVDERNHRWPDWPLTAVYQACLPEAELAWIANHWDWVATWALDVDQGRYPSIDRAIRAAEQLMVTGLPEQDDGGAARDALRIMTIHGAKGLEADDVWLIDSNRPSRGRRSRDYLHLITDWPVEADGPLSISLQGKGKPGGARRHLFDEEFAAAADEEDHLLYVALTRARRAAVLSGSLDASQQADDDEPAGPEAHQRSFYARALAYISGEISW